MYSEQNDYGTHAAVTPLHWTYQKLVCSVPHCRDMHEWTQLNRQLRTQVS